MKEKIPSGTTLYGDIIKDGHPLYKNQRLKIGEDERRQTLGANALEFFIYDQEEPLLKVNDECILVLENKEIKVKVTGVYELSDSLYMVGFYFQTPY